MPCVLEIFTNPLTTFGDGGTLAAFGFLTAYYLITIAAPVYLKKRGELKAESVVLAVVACVGLAVPTIGSFSRCRHSRSGIFPYIFLAWMVIGGSWLFILGRRNKALFTEIEDDLEKTMAASVVGHDEDMGTIIVPANQPAERPLAPTFDELDLALEPVS